MKKSPALKECFCVRVLLLILYAFLVSSGTARAQVKTVPHSPAPNIKVEVRHESLVKVLSSVAELREGRVGLILKKFSEGDARWQWIVKEGDLPRYTNALTELTSDGVVTTLNYSQLKNATRLSVARTLIHEMIHAYLVLHFRYDEAAPRNFPRIVDAYRGVVPEPDLNEVHHHEMAISFVGEIASALKEFGSRLGLKVQDAVYTDLAWGGLDFRNNDQIAEECKLRIHRRLVAEQTDLPVFPQVQPVGSQMGD